MNAPLRSAEITSTQVWDFWRYMQGHFRTTTVKKASAVEMQIAGTALGLIGIQRRERFLNGYVTTIGRRTYTPFDVGVPRGGWDLWSQVVVCVHEHQHVVQQDREGLGYQVSYLTSTAARARYETEALVSNLELQFWRRGRTDGARDLASHLAEYGCSQTDINVAARSLELSAFTIRQGAVVNAATRVALGWLNEHVPHLRAS